MHNYDVFISYRRDGGEATAKMLRDKLDSLGYRVFFDVESLRSGNFNTALYEVIDECKDFLLVLSPNSLNRCQNEGDWVRLEIEHALEKNLNIIPIMLRGFSFPTELPPSIAAIRYKNGIESNYQFFDAFIDKLRSFLVSPPRKKGIFSGHFPHPKLLILSVILVCVLFAGIGTVIYHKNNKPYPVTPEERNITQNLLYYVEVNLQMLETASGYLDESYQACSQYVAHMDTASHDSLSSTLLHYKRVLNSLNTDSIQMPPELRNELVGSPFSIADACAMHDYIDTFIESSIETLTFMESITGDESFVDVQTLEKIIDYYREILNEELKWMAYNTNELLLPIENEDALETFKYTILPELLYYIPLQASNWRYDAKILESDSEKSWNTIQRIQNQITALIGNENVELMRLKNELIQNLVDWGADEVEAEQLVENISSKIQLKIENELALKQLEWELYTKYEEAKKKFAPSADDESSILWGKMLRFLNLSLYPEAIECIEVYREKVKDEDEHAETYCAAAIRLINNIGQTEIDYGIIVVGYEPDKPRNEQYEIGDVIIAVNGKTCHNYAEYAGLKDALPPGEAYSVMVLRESSEAAGVLTQMELIIPADAPRVQVLEMTEKEYD